MARLHTWPKLAFLTSMMGLMAAGLLLARAQSYEVAPLDRIPVASCLDAQTVPQRCRLFMNIWLRWGDLEKALAPQGVRIEGGAGAYTIGFPGAAGQLSWPDPALRNPSFDVESVGYEFIDVISLAQIVAHRARLPVRLEGWERPRVWFGERVSLGISTAGQPNLGYEVYSRMLAQRCPCFYPALSYNFLRWYLPYEKRVALAPAAGAASPEVAWYRHRVQLEGGAGGVWGVWLPSVSEGPGGSRSVTVYADVAPARGGYVELYLPDREVRFVGSFAEASRSSTSTGVSKAALVDLSKPYTEDGWSGAVVVPLSPVSRTGQ